MFGSARDMRRRMLGHIESGLFAVDIYTLFPAEDLIQMSSDVEPCQSLFEVFCRLLVVLRMPLAHDALVVEQIDRAFDEDRAGHASSAYCEGFLKKRNEVFQPRRRRSPFDVRLHQSHLIDVLQSASAFQNGCSSAT